MTEKRYYAHKYLLAKNRVYDKNCHRFMDIEETVEHMNNYYEKYSVLKEENKQLKKKLNPKQSDVSEKRFIEFATQNTDNGEINNGFNDMETGEWYYTKDSENSENICDLLNELHEENMNLRAKHIQMIIILKDVVNDLKRMDTYRYAEHLEKITNLHFLSEKELKE